MQERAKCFVIKLVAAVDTSVRDKCPPCASDDVLQLVKAGSGRLAPGFKTSQGGQTFKWQPLLRGRQNRKDRQVNVIPGVQVLRLPMPPVSDVVLPHSGRQRFQ